MADIITALESFFISMPLPFLEIWGRIAFIFGFVLMIAAFGGFTFRLGADWGIGREKHEWGTKSYLAIAVTAFLISASGYIGSSIILVPGAQTFESIKDLFVFICILIFGYPALITVPFAYGIADIIEGVPVDYLVSWLPGYFINPACFWIAYQFFGKCPDFKKLYTWKWYLVFVFFFLLLEPALWGYICAGKFTPEISYRSITPALVFTTSITWILAPFAMLLAFPLARKLKIFWAEVDGLVHEFPLGQKTSAWSSGSQNSLGFNVKKQGVPLRLFLTTPIIILVLIIAGTASYYTLRKSEVISRHLASELHKNISENIRLRLENMNGPAGDLNSEIKNAFQDLNVKDNGKVLLIGKDNKIILSYGNCKQIKDFDQIAMSKLGATDNIGKGRLFEFATVTKKPLSRNTWIGHASRFRDDKILLTILNENYYLEDIRESNSQAAMFFSIGLVVILLLSMFLTSVATAPIRSMSEITSEFARGRFDNRTPSSRLTELNALSVTINHMADKLEAMIQRLTNEVNSRKKAENARDTSESKVVFSEQRLAAVVKSANLGVWEWDMINNYLVWDKTMYKLYGLPEDEESRGYEAWEKVVLEEDKEPSLSRGRAAVEKGEDFEDEFRIKRPDGSIRYIKAHSMIIKDEKGNPVHMIGINYDITDLRENEIELEKYKTQLEKMVYARTDALQAKTLELAKNIRSKDELEALVKERSEQLIEREKLASMGFMSAGLAHEIKNPLNHILNASQIIDKQLERLENSDDSEKRSKAITRVKEGNAIILNNSQRVDSIVKTLLMQVRASTEEYRELVDVNELIKTNLDFVLANYRPKTNGRIKVSYHHPESKVYLNANPVDLGRVFINILDNSCYAVVQKINSHSDFTAEIEINLLAIESGLQMTFYDNGTGIPEKYLSQMFTPFFTTKPPGQGTGLGMNFVYEIIKKYAGTISVNSKEGEYTEIKIFIPIKDRA